MICSFAHFWRKNERFARKSNGRIPSPGQEDVRICRANSEVHISYKQNVVVFVVELKGDLLYLFQCNAMTLKIVFVKFTVYLDFTKYIRSQIFVNSILRCRGQNILVFI